MLGDELKSAVEAKLKAQEAGGDATKNLSEELQKMTEA